MATLGRFSRCFDRLNWDVKQHSKRAEDIGPRYNGQLIAFKEHCGSYMAASHYRYAKVPRTKTYVRSHLIRRRIRFPICLYGLTRIKTIKMMKPKLGRILNVKILLGICYSHVYFKSVFSLSGANMFSQSQL